MRTDLFDYPLPERLIAQKPADRRDESRLLVVHRKERRLEHRHFRDLPEYLGTGDVLFRNSAAVIPARLHALRPSGGQVECLLLRPAAGRPGHPSANAGEWWCLLRPGKKLPVGATFGRPGLFMATVLEKADDGTFRVAFATEGIPLLDLANKIGEMPLPPYIAARTTATETTLDRERYQTVYADRARQVAVAAPTAGLHFTAELLAKLASDGVGCADLILHVGLGTFRPISTESVEDHVIHREAYELPAFTQSALFSPSGRRIAVGTTAVRTIEDYLSKLPAFDRHREAGDARPGRRGQDTRHDPAGLPRRAAPRNDSQQDSVRGEAGIFIYPPYVFRGVDALITNFHQPRSTLLCLVAAFLAPGAEDGVAWLKEIYAETVAREYRFFSYGDAMLIL